MVGVRVTWRQLVVVCCLSGGAHWSCATPTARVLAGGDPDAGRAGDAGSDSNVVGDAAGRDSSVVGDASGGDGSVAGDGGFGSSDSALGDSGGDGGLDGASGDAADGGGSGPAWARCEVNSDCRLRPAGCCSSCGTAELPDLDAVNQSFVDEHFAEVCPLPTPCPRCLSMANPWIIATCDGGQCVALDLREESVTSCRRSLCVLRIPECCQCGSPLASQVIAVRTGTDGALAELLCDPDVDCAACEPQFPDTVRASCSIVTRRCTVLSSL
jgi:hypothetical protein